MACHTATTVMAWRGKTWRLPKEEGQNFYKPHLLIEQRRGTSPLRPEMFRDEEFNFIEIKLLCIMIVSVLEKVKSI